MCVCVYLYVCTRACVHGMSHPRANSSSLLFCRVVTGTLSVFQSSGALQGHTQSFRLLFRLLSICSYFLSFRFSQTPRWFYAAPESDPALLKWCLLGVSASQLWQVNWCDVTVHVCKCHRHKEYKYISQSPHSFFRYYNNPLKFYHFIWVMFMVLLIYLFISIKYFCQCRIILNFFFFF